MSKWPGVAAQLIIIGGGVGGRGELVLMTDGLGFGIGVHGFMSVLTGPIPITKYASRVPLVDMVIMVFIVKIAKLVNIRTGNSKHIVKTVPPVITVTRSVVLLLIAPANVQLVHTRTPGGVVVPTVSQVNSMVSQGRAQWISVKIARKVHTPQVARVGVHLVLQVNTVIKWDSQPQIAMASVLQVNTPQVGREHVPGVLQVNTVIKWDSQPQVVPVLVHRVRGLNLIFVKLVQDVSLESTNHIHMMASVSDVPLDNIKTKGHKRLVRSVTLENTKTKFPNHNVSTAK